jgi:Flp pilus assembly protein TadG
MKKIFLAILILFGLSINLFAIWPTDEVISDVFNPDLHLLTIGGTTYITQSQIDSINNGVTASSRAITQGLTDVKNEIHASSTGIVQAVTILDDNLETEINASSKAITQGLLDVKNSVIESSNAVTEKLTSIQNTLNAGTTTYEKNPAKLYEGQTVYKSSGTAGLLTSATGTTITITDKVKAFYFMYESPSSEYCKIESSYMGVPIYLNDGKYTNIPIDYPQAVTFTISNMVVGSTLTWVVPTLK